MIHVAKPNQADPDNIVFMICGAFCTFDVDANPIPSDTDFIDWEGRRELVDCMICRVDGSQRPALRSARKKVEAG